MTVSILLRKIGGWPKQTPEAVPTRPEFGPPYETFQKILGIPGRQMSCTLALDTGNQSGMSWVAHAFFSAICIAATVIFWLGKRVLSLIFR